MARYLLDSDAVIDYLKSVPASVALLQDLDARGEFLCLCSVVVAEVWSGLRPDLREATGRRLRLLEFLATGPEEAAQAGQWRYDYARQGVTLATTDALIAATAHAHGATVVTGNVRHYPMDEVRVLALPRAGGSRL
ncbi:MAG: PIN domain-containing protein [Chloroflexi bacterium]|nr:PIN domain-containing protein [Chloroflexota bacterium]